MSKQDPVAVVERAIVFTVLGVAAVMAVAAAIVPALS